MEEFQKKLGKTIGATLWARRDQIVEELRKVKEFIDTDEKLEQIKTEFLESYILENPKIKKIDSTLKTLIEDYLEAD